MSELIQCAGCKRWRLPSRRDAVFCAPCAATLYARIDANSKRIMVQSPEERQAEANAIFARIQRNHGS